MKWRRYEVTEGDRKRRRKWRRPRGWKIGRNRMNGVKDAGWEVRTKRNKMAGGERKVVTWTRRQDNAWMTELELGEKRRSVKSIWTRATGVWRGETVRKRCGRPVRRSVKTMKQQD